MLQEYLLEIGYLIAALTFVIGLKMLSHPKTARRGNLLAAGGMLLGIIVTIFLHDWVQGNYIWIVSALVVGTVIGTIMALRVEMTAMPQMVSFFNGMGGGCVAVISLTEYLVFEPGAAGMMDSDVGIILAGILVGCVAFSGSIVAYGKLEGKITEKPLALPGQMYINLILLIVIVAIGIYILTFADPIVTPALIVFVLALIYGVLFVLPIGGADMPVVVSLLNSFTGIAAALAGFLYMNMVMITGGIFVGAAGSILTVLMCQAMNRSLASVLVGALGGAPSAAGKEETDKTVREATLSDVGIMLGYSQKVMIVPGYGLAVAQGQHLCRELDKMLSERGVDVKYAIHPVAGRMPGHMNVLLAEADIPYDKLLEMEEANEELKSTDVVVVIGANDVVNPAANDDPSSSIYGMPILNILEAKNTVVIKRSMGVGYAGIDNELFYHEKNRMLLGDAKEMLQGIIDEVKEH